MNPESPQPPRDEMEQRLTALLLGELSAEDSAALHREMEKDGELAKLFARLHHTVGLVRETVASPGEPKQEQVAPAKLSAARREKLFAHFKTVSPKEFVPKPPRSRLRLLELAAMLAILAILAAMLLPALSKAKSKSQRLARTIESKLSSHPADEAAVASVAPAPIDQADQTWGTFDGVEPVDHGIKAGVAGRSDFKAPQSESESLGKWAVGVTPVATPTPTIVLPSQEPAVTYEFATGDRPPNAGPLNLGEVTAQLEKLHIAPTASGRGGGGQTLNYGLRDGDGDRLVSGKSDSSVALAFDSAVTAGGTIAGGKDTYFNWSANKVQAQDTELTRQKSAVVDPATGLLLGAGVATAVPPEQFESAKLAAKQNLSSLNLNAEVGFVENSATPPSTPSTRLRGLVAPPRTGEAGEQPTTYTTNGLASSDFSFYSDTRASKQAEQQIDNLGVNAPEVQLRARFAEVTQNDPKALGYDWYLRNQPAKGLSEIEGSGGTQAGQPAPGFQLGSTVTTSGRKSGEANDVVSGSGDSAFGRYKNLDRNGAASIVPNAGRIEPEGKVYSLDVLGYADVPAQTVDAAGVVANRSGRRGPNSIARPGAVASTATPRSQISLGEERSDAEGLFTAGDKSKEVSLAKMQAAKPQLRAAQAGLPQNRTFDEKKRELQELTDSRRLLARRMNIEKTDLSLPRSAPVEIVDAAVPPQKKTGLLGGLFSSEYTSVARIKADRDKSDIDAMSGDNGRSNPYDPYFRHAEPAAMTSEAVLGRVVADLKLDELWAKQKGAGAKLKPNEAIALLKQQLDVRAVPNTTLVEIRAKSAKPEEAAQIANAVAAAYQAWRRERDISREYAGIDALGKELAVQDQRIAAVKTELDRLREELKVPDEVAAAEIGGIRQPAANAPIPQPEIQTLENNFSTFSLNVSDVSFKLAAASLERGQMPDAASIRSEEFINAFDYCDPEPQPTAPIVFAWERARYPFAHNRDLLRFSLKTAAVGRQTGRPLNIVLLLDNSGSMERADRVRIIREALRVLAAQLQPQDKLSVITFARTARLVADGISGDKAGEVAEQVSGVTPQGGTNLEDAMNLAYQTAARHYIANGINRVVLLTDGAANLGDVEPESLKQKVESERQQGVALDCFGIGWEGLNDDLLEVLSRNGDGRYGFINSPEEAATDFVGQLAGALKVAASDVKVQVEFNARRVTTYRQIGYAKHQLTKEQFRDNTVDAAEIAAQEAGNALYTAEVNPAGAGPIATVRVRYKVPGTTEYHEHAWEVPYTGAAISLEQSSPAMRLAATASAFSEWLVSSPFAGEVAPDALLGYLRGVPEVFGGDPRPKKLEWMIRQARSLEGK